MLRNLECRGAVSFVAGKRGHAQPDESIGVGLDDTVAGFLGGEPVVDICIGGVPGASKEG